ncbi:hypothetical protein [Nitrosomonas communis]|uniref:Uncharacterized protein n=1 Tax=Nitrosomonas communis TaxID=44574 RepID=A0A1H2X6X3_9PROT|nr:hypothetical protein [Nitrosomonas communis]SDW88545.1 hypothetical protein SAMN05421882_103521 [Nitrosomonas communis]
MSYTYVLNKNSSGGTLVESQNNSPTWSSPCLCNDWFKYAGKNSAYTGQIFYIKKESNDQFCLYNTTQKTSGGSIIYVPTGSALLRSY